MKKNKQTPTHSGPCVSDIASFSHSDVYSRRLPLMKLTNSAQSTLYTYKMSSYATSRYTGLYGQQINSYTHSWSDECGQLHAPSALFPSKERCNKVMGGRSVPRTYSMFWRRGILIAQLWNRTREARAQSMVTTPTELSRT